MFTLCKTVFVFTAPHEHKTIKNRVRHVSKLLSHVHVKKVAVVVGNIPIKTQRKKPRKKEKVARTIWISRMTRRELLVSVSESSQQQHHVCDYVITGTSRKFYF